MSWIGVTFVLFGLPTLVLAPLGGRLVDRLGGRTFAFVGGIAVAIIGFVYTLASDPVFPALVGIVEASFNAFLGPALYAILAAGSPAGRTSTAQGVFGAAGTLAFIIGSLVAGQLLAVDIRYAFYFFSLGTAVSFALGWLILRNGSAASGGLAEARLTGEALSR